MDTGVIFLGQSGRGIKLTHLHLVPPLRISGAVTSLPHMALWTRKTLPLPLTLRTSLNKQEGTRISNAVHAIYNLLLIQFLSS